jgi:hypothetical protein
MALVEHAERELRAAGAFDEDSDYGSMVGKDTLELVKTFASQGHSEGSAHLVVDLFRRVALYGVLTPLKNPMQTGEYIEVSEYYNTGMDKLRVFQSTRRHSLFSEDGGKTWYDIDKRAPWWKRMLGFYRAYVTF